MNRRPDTLSEHAVRRFATEHVGLEIVIEIPLGLPYPGKRHLLSVEVRDDDRGLVAEPVGGRGLQAKQTAHDQHRQLHRQPADQIDRYAGWQLFCHLGYLSVDVRGLAAKRCRGERAAYHAAEPPVRFAFHIEYGRPECSPAGTEGMLSYEVGAGQYLSGRPVGERYVGSEAGRPYHGTFPPQPPVRLPRIGPQHCAARPEGLYARRLSDTFQVAVSPVRRPISRTS